MLEAETAGGKRGMLGRRESAQTRFRFWPKFPVDRSDAENADPTGQNRHGAKNKRREAKKHKKQKPSIDPARFIPEIRYRSS
ncbi:MAG: hypothetical protein I8H87_11125 [Comamonadaceae bacterium]|jgi:hypothetical protein|nr:hypothetical protein [Comamonadaceae bacterium]